MTSPVYNNPFAIDNFATFHKNLRDSTGISEEGVLKVKKEGFTIPLAELIPKVTTFFQEGNYVARGTQIAFRLTLYHLCQEARRDHQKQLSFVMKILCCFCYPPEACAPLTDCILPNEECCGVPIFPDPFKERTEESISLNEFPPWPA